jgi:hypothetical protein
MSKIGVGIGEDFPVDDGGENRRNDAPDANRDEAYRKWREARREWKRQWKHEWKSRRREYRARYRDAYYDSNGRPYWRSGFFEPHMLWRAIAVVAALAAIVFFVTHIYFILGAFVIVALIVAAARQGFDPFDLPPYRHRHDDADDMPPRRPEPPAPRDTAN